MSKLRSCLAISNPKHALCLVSAGKIGSRASSHAQAGPRASTLGASSGLVQAVLPWHCPIGDNRRAPESAGRRAPARPTTPFRLLPEDSGMPLVSMRQLLDHAAENGYGIPAFNVNNLEQVQAIMSAAAEVDAPVIMQASAGARKYAGETFLRHLIEAAVESY